MNTFTIFDPQNDFEKEKLSTLTEEVKSTGVITTKPFDAAKEELSELLHKHESLPATPEALLATLLARLSSENVDVSKEDVVEAFEPIATHFAHILARARELEPRMEKDARWIYIPEHNTLAYYCGVEIHRLLSETRMLGIIPEDALHKLRSLKIGSIGASVAAGSMDLLVALGAETIHFYDEGILSPSNQPRMPQGHFLNNGRPKVDVVCEQLRGRNPYGDYKGFLGRVVQSNEDKKTPLDISFEEFSNQFDLFLEVADAAHVKAGFRDCMHTHHPTKPIFFIADVGSDPFSNLEVPEQNNFFGQGITAEQLKGMKQPATSQHEALASIRRMVGADFPVDHLAQFTLARMGINAFWSQTAISMRESAAITAKLLILYLSARPTANKNIHSSEAPTSLMQYSQKQLETISRIDQALFPHRSK